MVLKGLLPIIRLSYSYGMAALSAIVESASTVDLDLVNARVAAWADADTVRSATGHLEPADGLHIRNNERILVTAIWPDAGDRAEQGRLAGA